jgi:septum formation protein
MRLVLASSSPRRAELLRAAGIAFDVLPVDLDERLLPREKPKDYVRRLAEAKAAAAAARTPDAVVIGADTTVVIRKQVLGKPSGRPDAERMLRMLSGQSHDVLTGVCVRMGPRDLSRVEQSRVRMAALSDAEIAWYLNTGEAMDKAGGYAVQGLASRFITSIDGSYSNVVGLPVAAVYDLLKQLGCDILGI